MRKLSDLEKLPAEILLKIVSNFPAYNLELDTNVPVKESIKVLQTLRLVNKRFQEIVSESLFKHVALPGRTDAFDIACYTQGVKFEFFRYAGCLDLRSFRSQLSKEYQAAVKDLLQEHPTGLSNREIGDAIMYHKYQMIGQDVSHLEKNVFIKHQVSLVELQLVERSIEQTCRFYGSAIGEEVDLLALEAMRTIAQNFISHASNNLRTVSLDLRHGTRLHKNKAAFASTVCNVLGMMALPHLRELCLYLPNMSHFQKLDNTIGAQGCGGLSHYLPSLSKLIVRSFDPVCLRNGDEKDAADYIGLGHLGIYPAIPCLMHSGFADGLVWEDDDSLDNSVSDAQKEYQETDPHLLFFQTVKRHMHSLRDYSFGGVIDVSHLPANLLTMSSSCSLSRIELCGIRPTGTQVYSMLISSSCGNLNELKLEWVELFNTYADGWARLFRQIGRLEHLQTLIVRLCGYSPEGGSVRESGFRMLERRLDFRMPLQEPLTKTARYKRDLEAYEKLVTSKKYYGLVWDGPSLELPEKMKNLTLPCVYKCDCC